MKFVWIAALIILIDWVTKLTASSSGQTTYNEGLTFGLDVSNLFATLVTTVIMAVVFFYFFKQREYLNNTQKIAGALIVGGGISNLAERFLFGHVTDFIYFANGIFNIADLAIFAGIIVLLLQALKIPRYKKQEANKTQ